jgi:hypothetical protein
MCMLPLPSPCHATPLAPAASQRLPTAVCRSTPLRGERKPERATARLASGVAGVYTRTRGTPERSRPCPQRPQPKCGQS